MITIQADFKNSLNPLIFDSIIDKIKDLDIGLLINNVGVGQDTSFVEDSEENIKQMITINCIPVSLLTKKVLPLMIKR
jgi:17beta-estradiol 17-dehydrogenase / very-long-chain 3-oxoacyl-CoA reductase